MGMERSRRNLILAVGAIAAAAVVLVLAIVLSSDDESSPPAATQPTATGTTEAGEKAQKQGRKGSRGTTGATPAPPAPEQRERELTPTIRQRVAAGLETIRVRGGAPVGGLVRLVYRKGDRVQLRILPDKPGRFVIQPLGLTERGGPPRGAQFDFIAAQSGLFGVELREGKSRARVAVLVVH
jgi:hypothetical protein